MKQFRFFTLTLIFAFLQTALVQAQEDKAGKIVTDYYSWLDAGRIDDAVTLLTDDFKATAPFSPVPFDKSGWAGLGQAMKAGFPDLHHSVRDWFAKGNKVAVSGMFSGTNTGSMMGNPPTGNQVNGAFTALLELDGKGKIKSMEVMLDNKSFEAQLMAGIPGPREAVVQLANNCMKALDNRDLDAAVTAYQPNALFHGWAAENLDVNGYKQAMSGLLAAFPDSHFKVYDVLVDGNKVAIRHQFSGTHTGAPFQGIPASNRKVQVDGVATFDIKDGKAQEAWLNADFLGMLKQLGAIPSASN